MGIKIALPLLYKSFLICVVAFIASIPFAMPVTAATVRTFTSTADTTIWELSPTENSGSEDFLRYNVNKNDYRMSSDILIKFDLSELSGKTITSVNLRLYCYDYSGYPYPW